MNPWQEKFSRNRAALRGKFRSITGNFGTFLTGGHRPRAWGFFVRGAPGSVIGWIRSGTIGFLGVLVEANGAWATSAAVGDDCQTPTSATGPAEQVIRHVGVGAAPAEKAVVTVNEVKEGAEISLAMGDTLEVRLPSQPGTGYGWQVADPLPAMLRLAEKTLDLGGDQAPSAPGASATVVLRFAPVAAGTGNLRLVYARPWEKDLLPKKTYTLHVRVRSDAPRRSGRELPD